MPTDQDTVLFRFVSKSLKYFLLMLFGFALAYALSHALGVLHIIPILTYVLQHLFLPLGVILLCLTTVTVVLESLR
ncbi:hypothetical protein Nos7524_0261 [Nostoc sp. PCC 7524]|uniref:hypothetical protein n=1 Tax=Nostoc sp. (strain ATCC 29411 / PCC 7524) TaxID=28072 RepID=UPI00029F14C3|nr:hypothetical protein [Nostoc sp. PCC 7524]AFY46183.1 hypothetical protein Nos7524_0261 [Nostoc sp. PCC 7524]